MMRVVSPPPPPQAPITPEKKALIKELLELMNVAYNSQAVSSQITEQLQPLMASLISNRLREWVQEQNLALAEQKRVEAPVDESVQRIMTSIRVEFPKRINYGELVEKVAIEIYHRHFTVDEVKDLIVFYKTPTGQKLIKLLPQITAEMMSGGERLLAPQLTELITELVTDELMRLKPKQN